jgi:hypothetical protein
MDGLLYTAELVQEDGVYRLIVRDCTRDVVQSTEVSRKAVEKLPVYLSMLNLKPH